MARFSAVVAALASAAVIVSAFFAAAFVIAGLAATAVIVAGLAAPAVIVAGLAAPAVIVAGLAAPAVIVAGLAAPAVIVAGLAAPAVIVAGLAAPAVIVAGLAAPAVIVAGLAAAAVIIARLPTPVIGAIGSIVVLSAAARAVTARAVVVGPSATTVRLAERGAVLDLELVAGRALRALTVWLGLIVRLTEARRYPVLGFAFAFELSGARGVTRASHFDAQVAAPRGRLGESLIAAAERKSAEERETEKMLVHDRGSISFAVSATDECNVGASLLRDEFRDVSGAVRF